MDRNSLEITVDIGERIVENQQNERSLVIS
jgi:hypothetical protein